MRQFFCKCLNLESINDIMQIVIRLTEVELTTGSIIIEEPTVWARVWISAGSFLILKIM